MPLMVADRAPGPAAGASTRIRHRKFTGRLPVGSPFCAGRSGHAGTMNAARVVRHGSPNAPLCSRTCGRVGEGGRRLLPFVGDVDRVRP
jgi:hypothetical protein